MMIKNIQNGFSKKYPRNNPVIMENSRLNTNTNPRNISVAIFIFAYTSSSENFFFTEPGYT